MLIGGEDIKKLEDNSHFPFLELGMLGNGPMLLLKVNMGYRMEAPKNCPDKLYKIMQECWEKDPKERPSFQNLHSKLKKII